MTAEGAFSACNLLAMAGWLLLVFQPRRGWVPVVTGRIIPALLGMLYAVLVAANWGSSDGGFSSLKDVATLFSNQWLLLAGWLHYLAFDLFVGTWEVRDALQRRLPHWFVVPCLLLTFLFGPVGLLSYLAVRLLRTSSKTADGMLT